MSDTTDRIIELLASSPALRSSEIASRLGITRAEANRLLYAIPKNRVSQDQSYRWSLRSEIPRDTAVSRSAPKDTPLAKLCRYYLECLAADRDDAVTAFASSYRDLDYCELDLLPTLSDLDNLFQSATTSALLRRVQSERFQKTILLGYPTRLRTFTSRRGEQFAVIEPVFLIDLQPDFTHPGVAEANWSIPHLNTAVLSRLAVMGGASVIDESVQLAAELGFDSTESEEIGLDELALRLRAIRPTWDWTEPTAPDGLTSDPPLRLLNAQGIYNRAVLILHERSHFTAGLESELASLAEMDDSTLANTALGAWLKGGVKSAQHSVTEPILDIVPTNSEQKQAVLASLTGDLTVVTGPPGTGKSQVVTALLANTAWKRATALFSSKNNKAVDVVEQRTNALGPRPLIFRVGGFKDEQKQRLYEFIDSLLSSTVTAADRAEFHSAETEYTRLLQRIDTLNVAATSHIDIRNQTRHTQIALDLIRAQLDEDLFHKLESVDVSSLSTILSDLKSALLRADRSNERFPVSLFWPLFAAGRQRHLEETGRATKEAAGGLLVRNILLQNETPVEYWSAQYEQLFQRIEQAHVIKRYYSTLEKLYGSKPLTTIWKEYIVLIDASVVTAQRLWSAWLRIFPDRLDPNSRAALSEFRAQLQYALASGGNIRGTKTLFNKLREVIPCWAVTSLSARGRLPLEPGLFDLVVIDEASQCDIASALPLLFRARRAVVIGDPKQLRHISRMRPRQDAQLLEKHGLTHGFSRWGYSQNSLYDLATSFVPPTDLRDHFRSHKDIIEFSNQEFYIGRLRIATPYGNLRRPRPSSPAVQWVDVRGLTVRPSEGSAINQAEAVAVVDLLRKLLVEQRYPGSVGVVTPFRAQHERIRNLVLDDDELREKALGADFLAASAHGFQGDERDLIIFSPVVSSGTPDSALGFLRSNGNLFNVAITRARGALFVVGDYSYAINSDIKYLSSFARYVRKLNDTVNDPIIDESQIIDLGSEYPRLNAPEEIKSSVSEYEKTIYKSLYQRGLRPVPQFHEEQYYLDLAIFNKGRKLDIEIDGEHHRDWDGELLRRDQLRNTRLIELGWDVMRFWTYQIREDLSGCISKVEAWSDTARRDAPSR